jgi:alpha-galactosidase
MRRLSPEIASCALLCAFPAGTVRLSTLELAHVRQGWGAPRADRSVTGQPLSVAGTKFEHGVGTHAKSSLWIELGGGSERFLASVGVDDDVQSERASIAFQVLGDGRTLWESGVMRRGDPPKPVDVGLEGVQRLLLLVGDAGDGIDYDHADWADARFVVRGAEPTAVAAPREEPVILTPAPPAAPRIRAPTIHGCRPGNPFLFRVPATGERPMRFTAEGLPSTLALDASSGILRGTAP